MDIFSPSVLETSWCVPESSLSHSPPGRSQGSRAVGSTVLRDPKAVSSLPALGHCVLQAERFGVYCWASPLLSQAGWLEELP